MPSGHFERTEAHKKAIADALRGKKKSPEHNENNARARKGRKLSDEHKRHLSEAQLVAQSPRRGVPLSAEHRAKLSAAKKGKVVTLKKYGIAPTVYSEQIAAGNRWCSYRRHFAPAEGFASKQSVCKGCKKEFSRGVELKKKYGVTQDWYLEKLAHQGGKCAICRTDVLSKGRTNFAVDHDHVTGKVRGLLCGPCNQVLGSVERIPNWFLAITAYLAEYR